jgi:hypothetical protein
MFTRFRIVGHRLQISLVETRRVDGKVSHEHIASLGSIHEPITTADRIAFWSRVHQRMAKLSNRIDASASGKILGDIHAKVPMVTIDDSGPQLDGVAGNEDHGFALGKVENA